MSEAGFPGEELRSRREGLGLTLREAYLETRIAPRYIRALEQGDLSVLPAPCYGVGFLRTYCAWLELDPEPFVDRYRAHVPPDPWTPLTPFVRITRHATWKEGAVAWAAILAVLALGWFTYAAVVRPAADVNDDRVDAGARIVVEQPQRDVAP